MTPDPLTVFDGERLRAVLFPGRSDRLIVTFDHRRADRAGFAPANHATSFARQGFSQLSIKTAANDWFVNRDTEALERALEGVTADHERVQALGYSMGGYGALRFARALRARQVVAVSPQASIDPSRVPWDPRYSVEGRGWDGALGDLGPRAVPRLSGLIVLDPFVRPDLRHARLIGELFPGLRLARLGFGGHPAIRTLRGAGQAWVVQREAGQRRASAAAILQAHRAARRRSPGWWARMGLWAEGRRPALAQAARERASAQPARPGDLDGA